MSWWVLGGAGLGYVASYFVQPGLLREFMGIGEYILRVWETLGKLGTSHPDSTIAVTVVVSVAVGAVLGGAANTFLERVKRE